MPLVSDATLWDMSFVSSIIWWGSIFCGGIRQTEPVNLPDDRCLTFVFQCTNLEKYPIFANPLWSALYVADLQWCFFLRFDPRKGYTTYNEHYESVFCLNRYEIIRRKPILLQSD